MLDVRIVRVLVSQHLVPMRVHVGLISVPWEAVRMSMVFVVAMPMRVLDRLMRVLVPFPDRQPDAEAMRAAAAQNSIDGASGQIANERSTPKRGATEKWTWTSLSTSVLTVRPRQGH